MAASGEICGTCEYQNIIVKAVNMCYDCNEGYCPDCSRSHAVTKATRNHSLIPIDDTSRSHFKVSTTCRDHGKKIDFFCPIHDSVACVKCVTSTHKQCESIIPIEEAAENVQTSSMLYNLEENIKSIESTIEKLLFNNIENKKTLASQRSEIKAKIQSIKVEIINELDKVEKELVDDLNKRCKEECTKLNELKLLLEDRRKEINEIGDQIKIVKETSNIQTFLAIRTMTQSVDEHVNRLRELRDSQTWRDVNFESTLPKLSIRTSIGKLSTLTKPCPVELSSQETKGAQAMKHQPKEMENIDQAQWYYEFEDKGIKYPSKYPLEVSLILESALKKHMTEASFYDREGNKYIVDLNLYIEYPEADPTDRIRLFRIATPSTWVPTDENLKIFLLQPTDREYINVTTKFNQTLGDARIEFLKVERIQNLALYCNFVNTKKSMDVTNPETVNNEKELWHDCSVDDIYNICKYGFKRSYCGNNETAYGQGVYFTVNVNYPLKDKYSRPDSNGHKRMFLCRVLTGEYCIGNKSLIFPPLKTNDADRRVPYDTVTNDVKNPSLFVIFHESQAFPEYLVTFKSQ